MIRRFSMEMVLLVDNDPPPLPHHITFSYYCQSCPILRLLCPHTSESPTYCKSLPFFLFSNFRKGRLRYITPVGRLVGVTIIFPSPNDSSFSFSGILLLRGPNILLHQIFSSFSFFFRLLHKKIFSFFIVHLVRKEAGKLTDGVA